jgi:ribose 5-phosphate isomerase B
MLYPKIIFGSDHAGYGLKNELYQFLKKDCEEIIDYGCYTTQPANYADIAHNVCKKLENIHGHVAILICGTGQGMVMAANKHPGVRAGVAWNDKIAIALREHNDANVLCLPARHLTVEEAKQIVLCFLNTQFSYEERHIDRINKILI